MTMKALHRVNYPQVKDQTAQQKAFNSENQRFLNANFQMIQDELFEIGLQLEEIETPVSEENVSIVLNPVDANTKAINHRGYGTAPENTLPAYRLSAQMGYSYVECDVQFTSDGVPVLIHDTTIDRTSDGTGNVADFTYAQLLTYDFGSWKSSAYVGTTIPTFKDFITLCKKLNLRPYIEFKVSMTQDEIDLLVGIAKNMGMLNRCAWFGYSLSNIPKVLIADPTATVGVAVSDTTDVDTYAATFLPTSNPIFAIIQAENLTQALHNYCIASGFSVIVWHILSSTQVISFAEMGVEGLLVETYNVASILQS